MRRTFARARRFALHGLLGAAAPAALASLAWITPIAPALAADAAPSIAAADAEDVRGVVQAQLAAFAADDGARAYSFAAPGIQALFTSAASFMGMVRRSYPMLLSPRAIGYLTPTEAEGGIEQRLRIEDADGKTWLAVYRLERQPDRRWRITGCSVAPSTDRFV